MSTLILLILCGVVARLWYDVRLLRERVAVLGFAVPEVATSFEPTPEADELPTPVRVERSRDIVANEAEGDVLEEVLDPSTLLGTGFARTEREESVAPSMPAASLAPQRAGFEDIFGRRLPIWAGGVTLAVAGFLIVKYSIDAGLLSPLVRVVLGFVFGTVLIGAAEAALRGHVVVRDARVRQALSGAGIATFYAAILVAANLYGLVGPGTAFVGMAAVTALAGGLSIRFGAPSALLGLVGGLAAPALVGSGPPDVPLLAAYLALAVGGLCALARNQRWWWLGAAALVGGFGWGLALIVGGALDVAGAVSVGVYTLLLGIGLPLLLLGERARMVRLAGSVAGVAQMAALVATGGFAPLHWGLFGLLSVALVWLSRREAAFAEMPALGLGVALLLGLAWPDPAAGELALMLAATATIYGGAAAWRVWRVPGVTDAGQVVGVALAIGVLPVLHLEVGSLAWPSLIGAALAAGVAALGWRAADRREDARFATLAIAAGALLALAALIGLDAWLMPPALALVALALLLVSERAGDVRVERGTWAFGVATIVLLVGAQDEIARVLGLGTGLDAKALVRWAVPAGVAMVFARRGGLATIAQPVAVLLAYAAAAQVVPALWLPLVPALILAALGLRPVQPSAIAAAATLALGWATEPLLDWLAGAGGALLGVPLYVSASPDLVDVGLRLVAPALALMLVLIRTALPGKVRQAGWAAVTTLATIAAHVAYKQGFAIDSAAEFVRHGMAERTLWQLLLAAAALAAWSLGRHRTATAFGAASLAHFAWFTLLLHNPLWAEQMVGPWLILGYATALALVWRSDRALPDLVRPRGWALMVLITLLAFSALRQAAHGTMPLWLGTGEAEDIARSVLAIALAVGFLRHGIAHALRDWRIASLALMLGAVAKVFLHDAAGLDGLLRIGSFAALGFSLIGVGWLYSRYLPDPATIR